MRVLCRHGHFAFYPEGPEDISRFNQYMGVELERFDEYYTFPGLVGADRWSIIATPYLNLPAVVTCERQYPWEVMKANGFVYSLSLGVLIPAASVISIIQLPRTSYYYLQQNRFVQPGELLPDGSKVLSYDATYDRSTSQLKILEVDYE